MSTSDILSNNELWLQATQLCEYAYSILDDFPEEERWGMQSLLRKHAFTLSNDIAKACADDDPRNVYHSLNYASRDLHGLKNALTMAKRAKLISPDPQMMLIIEKLAADIADVQAAADKNIQPYLRKFEPEEKHEVKA